MSVTRGRLAGSEPSSRTIVPSLRRHDWREPVRRIHTMAATGMFGAALIVVAMSFRWELDLRACEGALLLIGGALIGVPHGSSDFVVACRLMRPGLGWVWLPTFLALYLALVGLGLSLWAFMPIPALLGFLVLSALHFGRGDGPPSMRTVQATLLFAARASTPLVPIFLLHPHGVAPLVAMLGGVSDAAVLQALAALRWPLLLPWAILVGTAVCPVVPGGVRRAKDAARTREALEILVLALAGVMLPPLLCFGLYFCLVHAVRHMIELADGQHPDQPWAALALVAKVVVPSALLCLVGLALTWKSLAGEFETDQVIGWSLRIVAALTLPHMLLEALSAAAHRPVSRAPRRSGRRQAATP